MKKVGSEKEITQLAKKRRGRPLALGNLEEKVQQYIRALRKSGTPVNARVVIAVAEGIVTETDHTLLLKNSRHIKLSLDWAYSLLKKMGYVKRKATTDKDSKKNLLLQKQIKKAVKNGKIPPELVIKCDQTGVNVVPSSQWTQAEQGSTRVEIAGDGDKQQVTDTLAGTLSGKLLPFQILWSSGQT